MPALIKLKINSDIKESIITIKKETNLVLLSRILWRWVPWYWVVIFGVTPNTNINFLCWFPIRKRILHHYHTIHWATLFESNAHIKSRTYIDLVFVTRQHNGGIHTKGVANDIIHPYIYINELSGVTNTPNMKRCCVYIELSFRYTHKKRDREGE